jgi:cytochrome bd-type quinol oxidase subunit 1
MAQEDKLIDYLSKEIETHTNNLMTFRARINLAVFVGPFALVAALLFRNSIPSGINIWSAKTLIAGTLLALIYLVLGWVCCSIEVQIWRKCNDWRKLIADLSSGTITSIPAGQLVIKENKVRRAYLVVYSLMIVAFLCVGVLISQVQR